MVAEFSIVPIGSGESLSGVVKDIVEIVDSSGLDYRLTAMGTIVEGEWDEIMSVIRKCHDKAGEAAGRVYTHVAVDDRRGAEGRIAGKVASVEKKAGKRFRT
ncbi:MAG: MTH1187 family thiamine-binding protein [bacterium]